jgi:hypothetical protein
MALGVSAGCASSRAALEVPLEAQPHEVALRGVAVREVAHAPAQTLPVALRLGESLLARLAVRESDGAELPPAGAPRTLAQPKTLLATDDRSRVSHRRSYSGFRDIARKNDALAVLEIGDLVRLEFSAASEPQEEDTLGYWDEFHLGRMQDQLLDVSWTWRQGPQTALIGLIGAPRTLDRDIEDEIFDPALVFVALGVYMRW